MPSLARVEPPAGKGNCFGISHVDHITTNFLTLQPALAWMQEVMGFERFWDIEFHAQNVRKGQPNGSGLKSVVM